MSSEFQNISILGGGLLGGSLALALLNQENPPTVHLWVRRESSLVEAQNLGISNTTTHLPSALAHADLLILAVPVGAMPDLITAAILAGLPKTCLITDVGSVKRTPHLTLAPILAPHAIPFIGSHPMAGSEKNGLTAALPSLFEGAACLLTNDDNAPTHLTEPLARFWQSVGCHTHWTTATAHDELVARISHLPHILAAAGAHTSLQNPSEGRFGGGGLRDTTRVAAGNPDMWAEILIENRHALLSPLRQTIDELREILASLENADHEAARQWLTTAKSLRDTLNQPR